MDAQTAELHDLERQAGRMAAQEALRLADATASNGIALSVLLGLVRAIAPEDTNPRFRQGVLDVVRGWQPPRARDAVAGAEGGG